MIGIVSVKAISEGEMFPKALIGFHQINLYNPKATPDIIENSHVLRICIPLFHYGAVWNMCNQRYDYGFKWAFLVVRFDDILTGVESGYANHILKTRKDFYIGLMK